MQYETAIPGFYLGCLLFHTADISCGTFPEILEGEKR